MGGCGREGLGREGRPESPTLRAAFHLPGAVAYFELVGIATKHLSPTLVAVSVALEPLCVSAIGICFFGYKLQPHGSMAQVAWLAAARVATHCFRGPPAGSRLPFGPERSVLTAWVPRRGAAAALWRLPKIAGFVAFSELPGSRW